MDSRYSPKYQDELAEGLALSNLLNARLIELTSRPEIHIGDWYQAMRLKVALKIALEQAERMAEKF